MLKKPIFRLRTEPKIRAWTFVNHMKCENSNPFSCRRVENMENLLKIVFPIIPKTTKVGNIEEFLVKPIFG